MPLPSPIAVPAPLVRLARVEDAAELARIGTQAFMESFANLYTPQNLEAFISRVYGEEKQRQEIEDPQGRVWVAEVEGRLAGYIKVGCCKLPHAEVSEEDGEIHRLYLLEEFQGYRLGRRLMEAALDWYQEKQTKRIWLGVWSENFRAQKFYQSFGFRKVGDYWFVVGTQRDYEFMYRLDR
jgi:ribosomal protein S18 acetylase RimI-like enzyme